MSVSQDSATRFGLQSFMGAPLSRDLSRAKVAILGIPYDSGTHPARIGSRFGPSAIREQSALVRAYELPDQDFDPIATLGAVDYGNVQVFPSSVRESFEAIEQMVGEIVGHGVIPVTMGGDGAVTLPQLRALHRRYPDLVVLHIDAHTDTYPEDGIDRIRYSTATTFARAAEEGLVQTAHSFHVGTRGPTYLQNAWSHASALGYRVIPDHLMRKRGMEDVLAEIHDTLAGRPVYLCFDMDIFDPSCAPGVCTPTWGGLTAYEGLSLIRALKGLKIVAYDVNTVSPPHDPTGMTAFLAASCMREFLFHAAQGQAHAR
ncbi:arginase family protein [Rhodoligotrophos defluvii]|uniref:arginase family protein n=1 Tax=Rhodoligotrophos defluvii TaxID=2561934 RepID=UPI00196202E4|nr:arginase family protein [Rhodoligotrophos defluvii]